MKKSIRKFLIEISGLATIFVLLFLLFLLKIIPDRYYCIENNIIVLIFTIVLFVISLFIYIYKKNKGLKNWLYKQQVIDYIEKSLISIGAHNKSSSNLVRVPRIKVDLEEQIIQIDIRTVYIRAKLDAIDDLISSALPCQFIAKKVYLSKNQAFLIIEYMDLTKNNRIIFEKPEDFINKTKELPYSCLLLDQSSVIELRDTPHILITGSSGTGKTFYANQLVLQALIKKYQVSILDYKRTYQMYKKYCNVAFSIEDIHARLTDAIEELHRRQQEMDLILEKNPNALAIDQNYPVLLIVIEEYLALVNSGIDKKVLADIEKKILEITTTGRSLGIHLVMIMQQASATTLNTSIRSNLACKLVFGTAPKSILETTFGIGSAPSISTKFEKGEGLGTFDLDVFTFQAPTINFAFSKILSMLDANN